MARLAMVRPVFHSEADFQHEFAWMIRELRPAAKIRLELPVPGLPDGRLDIRAQTNEQALAVELKYCTGGRLRLEDRCEKFVLRDHSAHDTRRYDFLKDVRRLESVVSASGASSGVAILLSNEPIYWGQPRRPDTQDAEFRIHEGRVVEGDLGWTGKPAEGTNRRRKERIRILGRYTCKWSDYSKIGDGRFGQFRYLSIEVKP